jgi:hypothetical protein
VQRNCVPITSLVAGTNPTAAVVALILAPVQRDEDVPVSFLVADKSGNCAVVSVYNITREGVAKVNVGDVVFLLAPVFKTVSVPASPTSPYGCTMSYPCMHIKNPLLMLVNGVPLQRKAIAKAQVVSSTQF